MTTLEVFGNVLFYTVLGTNDPEHREDYKFHYKPFEEYVELSKILYLVKWLNHMGNDPA